jgi:hypothetical protein
MWWVIAWRPMNAAEVFFDTNVLLYLLSEDAAKAKAKRLSRSGTCDLSLTLSQDKERGQKEPLPQDVRGLKAQNIFASGLG